MLPDDIEAMTRLGALADAERLLQPFEDMARTRELGLARSTRVPDTELPSRADSRMRPSRR